MEYRILEAAKMLGVSKNTIKYRMKKLPETMYRKSNDDMGTIYISDAGLEELRKMGENPYQTAEEPHQTTQQTAEEAKEPDNEPHKTTVNDSEFFSNHEKNEREPGENQLYVALQKTVDMLQEQLVTKDKQIEALTEALLTAQRTAEAAQALHAGTIQQQLEAQPKENTEEKDEEAGKDTPRHWLRRIFRKKQ